MPQHLNVLPTTMNFFHTQVLFFAAFTACLYAEDKVKHVACEGEIISYKYRGALSPRFRNSSKIQWFDIVIIKLTHPVEWKGNLLNISCNPSLPEGHILRQEGKTIKFKADRDYVNDNRLKQGVIFKDGKIIKEPKKQVPITLNLGLRALILDKEFTKAPKIPSDHLVFTGTLSKAVMTQSEKYRYNPWIITFSVDEVIAGEFSEKEISIRVRSPSRLGLKKGKRYKVKTGVQGDGLRIDPIPPSQQQPPARSK